MTVCVGLVDDGKVWVGADSRCVDGNGQLWERLTPKAWVDGKVALACAGNPAVGQMLRTTSLPTLGKDIFKWANTVLVDRLQEVAAHLKLTVDDRWTLIVGGQGRVLLVDCWYDVLEPANGIATTGSGGVFAAGALSVLTSRTPGQRLLAALQVACDHDVHCAPPFSVVTA